MHRLARSWACRSARRRAPRPPRPRPSRATQHPLDQVAPLEVALDLRAVLLDREPVEHHARVELLDGQPFSLAIPSIVRAISSSLAFELLSSTTSRPGATRSAARARPRAASRSPPRARRRGASPPPGAAPCAALRRRGRSCCRPARRSVDQGRFGRSARRRTRGERERGEEPDRKREPKHARRMTKPAGAAGRL